MFGRGAFEQSLIGDGEEIFGEEEGEQVFGFGFEGIFFALGSGFAFFKLRRFDGEKLDDFGFLADCADELAVAEVDGVHFAACEHFANRVGQGYGVGEIGSGGGDGESVTNFITALAEEEVAFFTDTDEGFLSGLGVQPSLGGFEEVSVVRTTQASFCGDEDEGDFFDVGSSVEQGVRWEFSGTANAQDKFVHFFAVGACFFDSVFGFCESSSGNQFHRPGDGLGVFCRTDALSNLLERCHSRFLLLVEVVLGFIFGEGFFVGLLDGFLCIVSECFACSDAFDDIRVFLMDE